MFGRFALIAYLFSVVLLSVGYMIEQAFAISLFDGWTGEALDELAGKNNISIEERPDLIFGNFLGAAQVVLALLYESVTGGVIENALSNLPVWNDAVGILVRMLVTFSGGMLAIHLLTGRGL